MPTPSLPNAVDKRHLAHARRAAELRHEMCKAPVGSKQRRFLRRAAERAQRRARLEASGAAA